MLYTTIDNPWQLRDEFIKWDRDYFTPDEYEAIFEYYSEDDTKLDVVAICCDIVTTSWEELAREFSLNEQEEILDVLMDKTFVLSHNNDRVLYFNY